MARTPRGYKARDTRQQLKNISREFTAAGDLIPLQGERVSKALATSIPGSLGLFVSSEVGAEALPVGIPARPRSPKAKALQHAEADDTDDTDRSSDSEGSESGLTKAAEAEVDNEQQQLTSSTNQLSMSTNHLTEGADEIVDNEQQQLTLSTTQLTMSTNQLTISPPSSMDPSPTGTPLPNGPATTQNEMASQNETATQNDDTSPKSKSTSSSIIPLSHATRTLLLDRYANSVPGTVAPTPTQELQLQEHIEKLSGRLSVELKLGIPGRCEDTVATLRQEIAMVSHARFGHLYLPFLPKGVGAGFKNLVEKAKEEIGGADADLLIGVEEELERMEAGTK